MDRPADPQTRPPQKTPPQGSETILIAEDESMVRELTREILEARGYKVLEAKDGQEALEICKTHGGTIDLTLTDIVMPRMSGSEFAENVAAVRPDMKIVFMSGYSEEISKSGILRGGVHFIEKPFTSNALALKIREALDES
jgi:CheY-like chemotaxis protein